MKLQMNRFWDTESQISVPPKLALILSILGLLGIGWIAFLWKLGSVGLVDETEPLFAEAARQMVVTGDWITPYFNQETRFDKPPLIYWLMAIAYQIFGVNEWAVRLPSALSAIALMGIVFFTLLYFTVPHPAIPSELKESERWQNIPRKAWFCAGLGGAIAALNFQTIAWGRIGVSDMLLSACMGIALLAFFWGYATSQPLQNTENQFKNSLPSTVLTADAWYVIFYSFIALAILAKGPVGIVLPGLIIGAFAIYLGQVKELWREIKPLRGILIITTIALPWYILVILANGQTYIDTFFGYHNFERFTQVVNNHSGTWYFYFLVLLAGFSPWSIYLPISIARLRFWKCSRWRNQPRTNHLGLFALFWLGGIFIFFTVAVTKLPSYILPALPAAAILVSLFWSEESFKLDRDRKPNRFSLFVGVSVIGNLILFLLMATAILSVPQIIDQDPAMPEFPRILTNSGLIERGALVLMTTALVGVILVLKRQWRWIMAVNLAGFVAFFMLAVMPVYFIFDSERQLPIRQLAEIIEQVKQPEQEVVMVAFEKPSLVFYSHQRIKFFRRSNNAREYLQQLSAKNSNRLPFLVLGYPDKIKGLEIPNPEAYQLIAKRGNYWLLEMPQQLFLPDGTGRKDEG
ncbi:ArnT family glycosyltransferase [Laspinema olomoucense]|uniref:ArnT family glycosyltransferase n=1 Tax=Laspinema olomoucense TaxID=3231600 RepID=UPI0021BA69A6|nr:MULTISPECIES: glycosyltransferase family 39 protein [unclassified Laspinema]MCT7975753.1 glycosyltransferase family 39 protein [Laspinema sp. D3d]MCT7988427.1 glycosyltransferase family 39 protein [Laspinema sp. D3a]MCT7996470.1 glycosyltransferase family 39 protein [Laspinema sp. D3c]